ncbi:MAG: tetratricopeptide repeat protein, partial [Nitrososphaeraceae archaeon]|nr:tetratricopeptide repeat protein [Nitrososphaeraceae archaeon]
MALLHFSKGDYENSILQLVESTDTTNTSKEILYLLAANYRGLGDYEKGLQELIKAKKLCESDNIFLPKIYNSMGSFYYLSSYYNKAMDMYTKSIAIAENNGNYIEYIKALGNLAIIDDIYGEVDEARQKLNAAIKKAELIQNTELLAFLYSELGVSLTYTNNIVEARINYTKSFNLYKEINNKERLAYLSSNIGSIYLQQSNYDAALRSYENGLKLAGTNVLAQTLNLIGLADVYSNISNYSKALEYYEKANALADSVNDVSSLIKIDEGIGALYFNTNRSENALKFLLRAEKKINEDFLPYEAAGLYYEIGVVLTSMNNLKSAEDYLKKGIEITERTEDIYNNIVLKTELAHVLINSNNLSEASKLLSEVYKRSQEYDLVQLMALQNLYLGKYNIAYTVGKFTNSLGTASGLAVGPMLTKFYKEKQDHKAVKLV